MTTISAPDPTSDETPEQKHCSRCKTAKAFDAFGPNRSTPDGRHSWCRDCTVAYERNRRQDPEYRALLASRARERRRQDPEFRALLASRARERRKRPEVKAKAKIADAAWHARNVDKVRARTCSEKNRAYQRAYIKSPEGREKHRIVEANRRAQIRYGQDKPFTSADWEAVKSAFGSACAYCLATGLNLEVEHLQPLVDGGRHDATNIVPACGPCNRTKNRRGLVQFLAHMTGA